MTEIFYYLLNRGWEVWAENLQVKILKEIEIQLTTHPNWFEIDLFARNPATKISAWQLIHMLKKKRMFIQLSDGSLGLLPERWYQEFERLFALRCPDLSGKEEESLRFSTAHAFHFAQMAEMAENSDEAHFKSDPAFEQIRREILNINGLKPLRLRQASCHPLLFKNSILNQLGSKPPFDENEEHSEASSNKFEFLIDKLKILVSSNHKALVFSQFTSLLKLFRKVLDDLGIPFEYLDGQSQDRLGIVTRFQESQEIPIMLAGIKTGGLGLNLTAADYCFILDPWWNPAIEQQAVDRIHRIGQDKAVNIYRIVSQNTVEEKMLVLKEKKQKIADQLMTADHSFLEQLNYEDFQFLFQ